MRGRTIERVARYGAPIAVLLTLAGCIPPGEGADPRYQRAGYDQEYRRPYEPRRLDEDVRGLPSRAPSLQAQSVRSDAQSIGASSYTVRSGDTLRGIANRTGAGSEAIARANGIAPPYVIYPGQRLEIPAGRYHLVRSGETGIAIARAYGADWSRIVSVNQLEEPYILRVGMRLLVPSGPQTLAERAANFSIDVDDIVTGGEPAITERQRPARPSTSTSRVLPSNAVVADPPALKGSFNWPVRGTIVSRFGPGKSGERNNGIQIAVPQGTPILASADGVVGYVGNEISSLGGLVILKHGDGWVTVYGHASQLLVQRGQSVKKGQTIALSGDSGNADRPEVHFEMRKGRDPVNPLDQLPYL